MEELEKRTVEAFSYESGYLLEGIDMGFYDGVKLSLNHPQYESRPPEGRDEQAAILLPPAEADRLAKWLMNSMGQMIPHLPNKLPAILKRLSSANGDKIKFRKGDKAALKQTVLIMKTFEKAQNRKLLNVTV